MYDDISLVFLRQTGYHCINERVGGSEMTDYRRSSVHCHSRFCDGKNTLEEMTEAAWRQGLQTIGFTGHSHTPCDLSYCMNPERTKQYQEKTADLKQQYEGRLDILCGLEWDLFSDTSPREFDYFIGSVHYLHGPKTGKYYAVDCRKEDLTACMSEEFDGDGISMAEYYFWQVEQAAKKKPDILGHFDLIKKLNGNKDFFDENDLRYREAALGTLEKVIRYCNLLEINTGAISRGYRNDLYPDDFLLKRWCELGGDVIITADAHRSDMLTAYYDEAAKAAERAGFSSVIVLTKCGFEKCRIKIT